MSKPPGPILLQMRTISHKITWFLGTRFPDLLPLVFVVGFPRSGTVWATQIVADYLQWPYPRNSFLPVGCEAVVHGHEGVQDRYRRAVYMVRDPRDVVVSQYFFHTRGLDDGDNPKMNRWERRMLPRLVNKAAVAENLVWYVENWLRYPGASPLPWHEHVQTYFNRRNENVALLQYEKLLNDGPEHFARAMETLTGSPADADRVRETLNRFSFARQASRKPGQEDRSSHMRKGSSGDWRTHMPREAGEILEANCGQTMRRLGYSESADWVLECLPLAELREKQREAARVPAG